MRGMTATLTLSHIRFVLLACVLAGIAYIGVTTATGIQTVASTTAASSAAMVSPVMVDTPAASELSLTIAATTPSRVSWILMEGAKAGKKDAIRIIEQAAADGDTGARQFLRTLAKHGK